MLYRFTGFDSIFVGLQHILILPFIMHNGDGYYTVFIHIIIAIAFISDALFYPRCKHRGLKGAWDDKFQSVDLSFGYL
jgi:hypothetical protein